MATLGLAMNSIASWSLVLLSPASNMSSKGFNKSNLHFFRSKYDFLLIFGSFGFVFVLILSFEVLPAFYVKTTENCQVLKVEFSKIANFSGFY